jgi:predicted RNA-binding protein (virulence factor B family)
MQLGKFNLLTIQRITSVGAFLSDEDGNEVLLPNKYMDLNAFPGDKVNVFVYKDSEDRPIATNLIPKIELNEFACLKVVDTNSIGAFMDWGLEKDLFVPFKEQTVRMDIGKTYPVYLYLDQQTERLVASAKTNKFLSTEITDIETGDEVDLLITHLTELGVNVIINNKYKGLIYHDDLFSYISIGDKVRGFIKSIKPNGNIDVTLRKQGFDQLMDCANTILDKLKEKNGFLALHDKSSSEEIMFKLQMSKKNFKKAVGILLKNGQIKLSEEGIKINK